MSPPRAVCRTHALRRIELSSIRAHWQYDLAACAPPIMRPFLDRYLDPVPIRARGAFQLVAVRRAMDGEGAVLVLPGANADAALVAAAFEEIERTHAVLDHPKIPRVAQRSW